MATLRADSAFQGGWYDPKRPPIVGLRAFGRVYASWGLSQAFYWEEVPLLAPILAQTLPCSSPRPALPLFLHLPCPCSCPNSPPITALPLLLRLPSLLPPTTTLSLLPLPTTALPRILHLPLLLPLPTALPLILHLALQGPYAAADALLASCSYLMHAFCCAPYPCSVACFLVSQSLHFQ